MPLWRRVFQLPDASTEEVSAGSGQRGGVERLLQQRSVLSAKPLKLLPGDR